MLRSRCSCVVRSLAVGMVSWSAFPAIAAAEWLLGSALSPLMAESSASRRLGTRTYISHSFSMFWLTRALAVWCGAELCSKALWVISIDAVLDQSAEREAANHISALQAAAAQAKTEAAEEKTRLLSHVRCVGLSCCLVCFLTSAFIFQPRDPLATHSRQCVVDAGDARERKALRLTLCCCFHLHSRSGDAPSLPAAPLRRPRTRIHR